YAMEPAQLKAGSVGTARLHSKNLDSVTSGDISGPGIKVELLDALPTELHMRLTVDKAVDGGSRLIAVRSHGNKTATVALDVRQGTASNRSGVVARGKVANAAAPEGSDDVETRQAPDLVMRAQDFTMSPVSPKAGNTVVFHVRVRN